MTETIYASTRPHSADPRPWYCEAGNHRCHFNIQGDFVTHEHEMVYAPREGTLLSRQHEQNDVLVEFREDLRAIDSDFYLEWVRMARFLAHAHLRGLEADAYGLPCYAHAARVIRRYASIYLTDGFTPPGGVV